MAPFEVPCAILLPCRRASPAGEHDGGCGRLPGLHEGHLWSVLLIDSIRTPGGGVLRWAKPDTIPCTTGHRCRPPGSLRADTSELNGNMGKGRHSRTPCVFEVDVDIRTSTWTEADF